jgi:hypothetical protein
MKTIIKDILPGAVMLVGVFMLYVIGFNEHGAMFDAFKSSPPALLDTPYCELDMQDQATIESMRAEIQDESEEKQAEIMAAVLILEIAESTKPCISINEFVDMNGEL